MCRRAIVTGASSGIGRAISYMLLEEGYEVYGFGRNFDEEETEMFHPVVCDLMDTDELLKHVRRISRKNLCLLVNNAATAYYGMHDEMSAGKIMEMTRTNLEVPMILCSTLMQKLRQNQGMIVNVASVTAVSVNTHGAVYGALKAGLLNFSRSLFEENRKSGVRVMTILPDMTDTQLYRNADFTADPSDGTALRR